MTNPARMLGSVGMMAMALHQWGVAATNDLRWARIVLEEQIFPSPGFLGMASAFTAAVRDDASVDIPWGTPAVGGPTNFKPIRERYGNPASTTNAEGTIAQTLQGKPRRTVSYHWYGAMGLITEGGNEQVIGLALRADLLKKLEKEPDLKMAAERWLESERQQSFQANCLRNLRQLDAAKRRWASDTGKVEEDVPFADHIVEYLPTHTMPECPEGGTYRFNVVGKKPDCILHGNRY